MLAPITGTLTQLIGLVDLFSTMLAPVGSGWSLAGCWDSGDSASLDIGSTNPVGSCDSAIVKNRTFTLL